jgi:dolichol-phosphate mannosyltransferase
MTESKKISVVVPVYNEEANICTAYRRLVDVGKSLGKGYELEIIFTDNHSEDRSFELITSLAQCDQRVRGVRFARNFGFNKSVLTGYRLARGDAAIQIDCDLQDPPELLPEFLARWEAGHDLVIGVRRTRKDGQTLQWARSLYYRLLERLSEDNVVANSGDFRLLDRSLLEQLHWVDDAMPYVRGLTSVLSHHQGFVFYDRSPRKAGKSKFPLRRLINLAVDGLLSHSTIPLRFATYAGLIISIITLGLTLMYVIGWLFFSADWPAGFATTTVLLLLGISLNATFLGILGEYVARIYIQVRKRPLAIIERSVNIPHNRNATATSFELNSTISSRGSTL